MAAVTKKNGTFSITAYSGDAKTLLAFNLDKRSAKNLAGFTIECEPDGQPAYYIHNELQFEKPGDHAQDPKEPANSSINAPIHKFRWLHIPGSVHQGTKPFMGPYTYTVTPRYFDNNSSLQPLDPSLSVAVKITVAPFKKNGLELGFTRGFTQSQAFVHHFGLKALIRPKGKDLLFKTNQESGINAAGEHFTYADEYEWLGFTARQKIFDLLNEVLADKSLRLDMFAYDLNEPDLLNLLLALAKSGQIRIILDNAGLHHSTKSPTAEDQFETLFKKAASGKAAALRGHFARYAHDKVLIVSNAGGAIKVLTGSTNFSVTGLYVNSNHVIVFSDPQVAATYAEMFETVWNGQVAKAAFVKSKFASQEFAFSTRATPQTKITFAPHANDFATKNLQAVADRISQEGKKGKTVGSVLFAVMEIDNGTSPVFTALNALHKNQTIFSYGISDSPEGIFLYTPGTKSGVLVTGKPRSSQLPAPFDQVPSIGGVGHQIHHKFVVCGFNSDDPVVYCGSSNLAVGGEESNGDNLLAIHDGDVATAFALEALGLVDHFNFLDRFAKATSGKQKTRNGGAAKGTAARRLKQPPAAKQSAAAANGWFLSTNDKWAEPYFDPKDLHCIDRQLFG